MIRHSKLTHALLSSTFSVALALPVSALLAQESEATQDAQHQTKRADEQHGRGYLEEVVVTATLSGRSQFDIVQSTDVLSGDKLEEEMSGNLGETLDHIPGISNSYFGPGAGRPIIRGLGGDRIRVLIGGIGSIDASSTSPDHAVAGDPLTAQSIEIIRGPATLLYGNNALGGVINILDGRIPFAPGEAETTSGAGRALLGSNADEVSVGGAMTITPHDRAAFHIEATRRSAGDITIPGFMRSETERLADPLHADEGEEEVEGKAPNTHLDSQSFSAGGSYFFDGGFLGASLGFNTNNYGIPAGHAAHGDEDEHDETEIALGGGGEEDVRIDLEQIRFDVMGETAMDFLVFDAAKFRFGLGDYQHVELEGDAIGTTFLNNGWEGRVELTQKNDGARNGAFGFQGKRRDFEAIGDEAFVPPSTTHQFGVFGMQEWDWENTSIQVGARIEFQDISAQSINMSKNFTGVSISGGISRYFGADKDILLGLTAHSTERAPNAEELFSDGPHIATQVYELGNNALQEETALGGEVTLRKRKGIMTGGVTFFMNRFDNFIFEEFTGAEIDHLPVAQFAQADTMFYGGEFEVEMEAWHNERFELFVDAALDFVVAEQMVNDQPLPRIPPRTFKLGSRLISEKVDLRIEGEWAAAQNRIAIIETATDGYFKLDAGITFRPYGSARDLSVVLQVRNITNQDIRYHTSFLKELLPAPGRDFRLSVRAGF